MNEKDLIRMQEIRVFEFRKLFEYELHYTSEKCPYYVPKDELQFEAGVYTDSYLVIPIQTAAFNFVNPRKIYHIYRLRFDSEKHTTVAFGPDPNNLGWTNIDITFTVRKMDVSIGKNKMLVVQKHFDPIYPPRVASFQAPSPVIGKMVLEMITNELEGFVSYYLNHNVT